MKYFGEVFAHRATLSVSVVPGSWNKAGAVTCSHLIFAPSLFLRCSPFLQLLIFFSSTLVQFLFYQPCLPSQVFHHLLHLLPPSPCVQTLPIHPRRCRCGLRGGGWLVRSLRFCCRRCGQWRCCGARRCGVGSGGAGSDGAVVAAGSTCRSELHAVPPGLTHPGRKILAAPWPHCVFFCTGSGRPNSLCLSHRLEGGGCLLIGVGTFCAIETEIKFLLSIFILRVPLGTCLYTVKS